MIPGLQGATVLFDAQALSQEWLNIFIGHSVAPDIQPVRFKKKKEKKQQQQQKQSLHKFYTYSIASFPIILEKI